MNKILKKKTGSYCYYNFFCPCLGTVEPQWLFNVWLMLVVVEEALIWDQTKVATSFHLYKLNQCSSPSPSFHLLKGWSVMLLFRRFQWSLNEVAKLSATYHPVNISCLPALCTQYSHWWCLWSLSLEQFYFLAYFINHVHVLSLLHRKLFEGGKSLWTLSASILSV